MSRVFSSFHASAPGSLTTCAPRLSPGCHTPNAAPVGSAKNAMRPAVVTSIGGTSVWPPASAMAAAVASRSSAQKYVDQATGCPGCMSGMAPPTVLPSFSRIV